MAASADETASRTLRPPTSASRASAPPPPPTRPSEGEKPRAEAADADELEAATVAAAVAAAADAEASARAIAVVNASTSASSTSIDRRGGARASSAAADGHTASAARKVGRGGATQPPGWTMATGMVAIPRDAAQSASSRPGIRTPPATVQRQLEIAAAPSELPRATAAATRGGNGPPTNPGRSH
jgi:hypothetical protein